MYADVLKILIKFLSYALSLLLPAPSSSTRRSLILLVVLCRSERMVPMIHPFGRTVGVVSRSSRDQRDTRPRLTHVTLTRGVFYYFVPLFVVNSLSRIIDVLISLKFFSFNTHTLSGISRYKGLSKIHSFFENTLSPRSCSIIRMFVSLFFLLSITVCLYLRISEPRVR